jgi:histone deacetylase 1/2
MKGHAQCLEFVKKFNVPLMILGGGGYTIRNVARAWAYETALAVDTKLEESLPFNDYFEYYGPDFVLDVPSSNMENLNTREYLEKTKNIILENLREVQHAPSVQLQPIPRDPYQDTKDAEQDDVDPDVRISQKDRDERVSKHMDLSDSEDEGDRRDRQSYKKTVTSSLLEPISDNGVKTSPSPPKSPKSPLKSPSKIAGAKSPSDAMDVDP